MNQRQQNRTARRRGAAQGVHAQGVRAQGVRAQGDRAQGDLARGVLAPDTSKLRAGSWRPHPPEAVARVANAAVEIVTTIGMADAPPELIALIERVGGKHQQGRLLFPRSLIEQALAQGPRQVLLAGQDPRHDLLVGGAQAYAGTGGAAPFLLDDASGQFRPSNLADLYAAARLADRLEHIHFFARSLVARDIGDPRALDLATAAACLLATTKHVMVQASTPEHLEDIHALCVDWVGGAQALRERPILSLNINPVVPPLRFDPQSVLVLMQAARLGIPVHCNVFGQLGASSPVTIAGSVAQTLAEVLAGLAIVQALAPGAPRIAGPRAMITDLRSGAMAGGSGEQALANALMFQVMRAWDLPSSAIAGASDSKLPDFQAGYEKAMSVNTAIQAGANLITQAAGSQAGLMAVSLAAMVADNDMLGALARANDLPPVDDDSLDLASIRQVVTTGEGHFLGQPQTYERMRRDFLYPDVADRSSIDEWQTGARLDLAVRARQRANELTAQHWPKHGPAQLRRELEQRYGLHPQPKAAPSRQKET